MKKALLSCLMVALSTVALNHEKVEAKTIDEVKNPVELTYRTMGAATGITLGIPIATLRVMPEKMIGGVEMCASDLSNNDDPQPIEYAFATIPGVLIGLSDGLFTGVTKGFLAGSVDGFDKPFSAQSFSLGELD